jgi:hypothetical protein
MSSQAEQLAEQMPPYTIAHRFATQTPALIQERFDPFEETPPGNDDLVSKQIRHSRESNHSSSGLRFHFGIDAIVKLKIPRYTCSIKRTLP